MPFGQQPIEIYRNVRKPGYIDIDKAICYYNKCAENILRNNIINDQST